MKITQLQGCGEEQGDTLVLEDGREAVVQHTIDAEVLLHVVGTNEAVMLPVSTELEEDERSKEPGAKYHVKK